MKKIIFLAFLFMAFAGMAQESRTGKNVPFVSNKYGNDIIIEDTTVINQREVKVAVAFNGWIYAAYTTEDVTANKGGITIRSSRDNGMTWKTMDNYFVPDVRYTDFDMVVAGTDTSSLQLTLAGIRHNLTGDDYVLFIDNYNATTGSYITSPYWMTSSTRRIYDVAMATDYRFPAVGASPYSIGVIYSVYGGQDSLNYIGSVDGGSTFSVFKNIYSTSGYLNKISLAYGRSVSASNGRYFAAWEVKTASMNPYGKIYTSRNQSMIDGDWIPAIRLDSISSSMTDFCRHPSIAVQYNDTDNDSSSVTAIVLVERAYTGLQTDYDILGFYNKRAHYTNYWFRLDVLNTSDNAIHPDITYDPGYNNFLAVYFDSTTKTLPYCVNNMNLTNPSTWGYITYQYNDDSTLSQPWPRVEINPVVNMTTHVWIKDNGTRGVAMLDGEYMDTGVPEDAGIFSDGQLYPNPATDQFTLQFSSVAPSGISIRVFDATGKLIESRSADERKGGDWFETFDVSNWNNGLYLISIVSGKESLTKRLVVSH